jgi:hypothetical protein
MDRPALPPFDDSDRRAVVLRMGETLGWPEFDFDRETSIAVSEKHWRAFAAKASSHEITLALKALEALGGAR